MDHQALLAQFETPVKNWHHNMHKPLAEARGLENSAYTDAHFFRLERDSLLARNWLAVANGADIPSPGDALPMNLLGQPIVLVRGRDQTIRAFHNICSHRGATLLETPAKGIKNLQCPYHAWTYDLDGKLIATPFIGGPGRNRLDSFDPACHGLKPIPVHVWFDIVFIVLRPDGTVPDFFQEFATLADRWQGFDAGAFSFGGDRGTLQYDIACNWKLAVENYCDAYHLPWVHPSLNRYSRLQDHYGIAGVNFAGQGSRVYAPPIDDDGNQLPAVANVPVAGPNGAEYIALFPNVLIGLQSDHYFTIILYPEAPDRTKEKVAIYYAGRSPSEERYQAVLAQHHRNWDEVFDEDVAILERCQRGRHASGFTGGVFSEVMEEPTHAFYLWYTDRLRGSLQALKQ